MLFLIKSHIIDLDSEDTNITTPFLNLEITITNTILGVGPEPLVSDTNLSTVLDLHLDPGETRVRFKNGSYLESHQRCYIAS